MPASRRRSTTLAQQRRLAFASRTPGRTQHINLFELGPKGAPEALLADLPGYGYAAVERAAKLRWQEVMAEYLAVRRNLPAWCMLVDSRHRLHRAGPAAAGPDRAPGGDRRGQAAGAADQGDKLSRRDAQRALNLAQAALAERATADADIGVALFSALSRQGLSDTALLLRQWVPPAAAAPQGAVAPA
jgi:GTP-binding protein